MRSLSATTLLGGLGYAGAGGAAGHATSASVGGGTYNYSASYDADTRLSSLSVSTISSGTTLFASQRGYDAASNVTAVATTLPAGTDNQAFCYDEQNRLTWAGSSGSYTQLFTYDTLDRLQSGPLGSYSYGDSAHLHAATSIGSGGTPTYTATYDAVGDMTCRAPDTTATCAGTPTGAVLGYDNEGRLTTWRSDPQYAKTATSFLHDGAGNRVAQQVTFNGGLLTSTTYVAGGLEEIASTTLGGATLTKYFTGANGLPTAERIGTNGPLSYLATDGQGTVSEALDGGGNVTFAQLYTPYGATRYTSGSSPTTLGYTGQRADSATGLDYYQARYYDPVAGQFASADTVADGLNRYGYVAGNPETYSDPTGHRLDCGMGYCGGRAPTPPPPPPAGGTGSTWDGVCNRHLCPPSPPSRSTTSNICHSDATCDCYTKCGGESNKIPYSGQPVGPSDWAACTGPSHPDWCLRYYDYNRLDVNGYPMSRNTFDEADYFYFLIAAGEIASVQVVVYYIKALGRFMDSMGVSLGVSFSITGLTVLAAGYGLLLTKGTPTGDDVSGFLSGLSVSASAGTIASLGFVHSLSGLSAEQYEVDTAIATVSVGGSYGGPSPTQFCPVQYLGPIAVPSCVWG